jgi:hypothetical protein
MMATKTTAPKKRAAPKKKTSAKVVEKPALILAGTWVILGNTNRVPEELVGHEAYVTVAPMKFSDGDEQIPMRHQYQDADTEFSVRTRDQFSATVHGLTVADFAVVSNNGRHGLGHAG